MRAAARGRLADLAARRRNDPARCRHDTLWTMVAPHAARGLCLRAWCASARRAARASLGVGIPTRLAVGSRAAARLPRGGARVPALGLARVPDLSRAGAAADLAQPRAVRRACDARELPGTGALSRSAGSTEVPA